LPCVRKGCSVRPAAANSIRLISLRFLVA
jgi:hypothetical protein